MLSVTSVYDLPFGKGGLFFTSPTPVVGALVNGWTASGIFNAESGQPVSVNTGYTYTCPGTSYRPAGGTSVGHGRWFSGDASCWQGLPTYGLQYLSGTTAQVRTPTIPTLDASVQKTTPIHENLVLSLRLDAFNSLNSVLFGGPNNNPGAGPATFSPTSGWSGFGTVGAQQQNFPRVLQVSGKIAF